MFCIKCGRELEDEANFCPVCGAKRAEASGESYPHEKKKTHSARKGRAGKLAAVIIIAVMALVVALIFGGQSKSRAKPKPVRSTEVTDSVNAPAKSGNSGSGLTTKDELKDKYDVKPTPKSTPEPTAKPKSSKSGSGLVTKDDLFKKYPGKSDFSQTEQVSGATEN